MTRLKIPISVGLDVDDPPLLPAYLSKREIIRAHWTGEMNMQTWEGSVHNRPRSGYEAELLLAQTSTVLTCDVMIQPAASPLAKTYGAFVEKHGRFEFFETPIWLHDLDRYLGFWARGEGKRWGRSYRWNRSPGPWHFEPHAYPMTGEFMRGRTSALVSTVRTSRTSSDR